MWPSLRMWLLPGLIAWAGLQAVQIWRKVSHTQHTQRPSAAGTDTAGGGEATQHDDKGAHRPGEVPSDGPTACVIQQQSTSVASPEAPQASALAAAFSFQFGGGPSSVGTSAPHHTAKKTTKATRAANPSRATSKVPNLPVPTFIGQALFTTSANPGGGSVPTLWLAVLVQQLVPADRLAIFRSCKAGRDSVLQYARKAAISLRLSEQAAAAERQATALRHALYTRGSLPSKLTVTQAAAGGQILKQLASTLQGHGQHVADLSLPALGLYDAATQTDLLAGLAAALPSVRTADLGCLSGQLPPVPSWPQLTELQLSVPGGYLIQVRALSSISGYMGQLSVLCIHGPVIDWQPLLTSASTSLVKFACTVTLTDELLHLLLAFTPEQRDLGMGSLYLRSDMAAQSWAVERLWLLGMQPWPARQVARLPHNSHAPMAVGASVQPGAGKRYPAVTFTVSADPPGFEQEEVDRLQSFLWPELVYVHLCIPEAVTNEQAPLALAAGLQQCAQLSVRGADGATKYDIWVQCSRVSEGVCQELTAVARTQLPATSGLWLLANSINDQDMDVLCRDATGVSVLSCTDLQLANDHYIFTCSWSEVQLGPSISTVPVQTVVRLPRHIRSLMCVYATGTQPLEVRLAPEQAAATELARLTTKLWHYEFRFAQGITPTIVVSCPADVAPPLQPTLLGASLAVVQAVKRHSSILSRLWCVRLRGWTLTPDVVSALSDLPPWVDTLHMTECTWLWSEGYDQLPAVVPTTCSKWLVPKGLHTYSILSALQSTSGSSSQPAGQQPPRRLSLGVGDEETVTQLKGWMRVAGVKEGHATVYVAKEV